MIAGRVRITDLIESDAASPRYCGHSIGRVLAIDHDGGIRHLLIQRIERSGDRVYGVGKMVSRGEAERLQTRWDIRWGIRCAPVAPTKPERRMPGSTKVVPAKLADVDAAAAAIVAVGYREMAKRHHPDAGGSHQAMSLLTQAKMQLCQILDLAKEGAV